MFQGRDRDRHDPGGGRSLGRRSPIAAMTAPGHCGQARSPRPAVPILTSYSAQLIMIYSGSLSVIGYRQNPVTSRPPVLSCQVAAQGFVAIQEVECGNDDQPAASGRSSVGAARAERSALRRAGAPPRRSSPSDFLERLELAGDFRAEWAKQKCINKPGPVRDPRGRRRTGPR